MANSEWREATRHLRSLRVIAKPSQQTAERSRPVTHQPHEAEYDHGDVSVNHVNFGTTRCGFALLVLIMGLKVSAPLRAACTESNTTPLNPVPGSETTVGPGECIEIEEGGTYKLGGDCYVVVEGPEGECKSRAQNSSTSDMTIRRAGGSEDPCKGETPLEQPANTECPGES